MSKELAAVYWRVRLQRARETHAGARQALRLHPRVVMQRMEASSAALQARPSSSSPSPTLMPGGSVPPPALAFLNHISSASEIPMEGTRDGGTVRVKRRPGDRPASRSPPLRQRAVSAHPPISFANHALRPHTSHGMPLEIEGRGRKDGPSGWLPHHRLTYPVSKSCGITPCCVVHLRCWSLILSCLHRPASGRRSSSAQILFPTSVARFRTLFWPERALMSTTRQIPACAFFVCLACVRAYVCKSVCSTRK